MIQAGVLKALLDEGGADYSQNSKSFILDCPRCRKKDKMYIRKSDGRFVCWVCKETDGFSGAPEWALTELLGIPVQELRARLYGDSRTHTTLFLDLQLDDFFDEEEREEALFVPDGLSEMEPDPGFRELTSPFGEEGAAYLEGRGLSLDLCLEYGIKYWPAHRSVVFPAMAGPKLVGWQTRRIDAPGVEDDSDPLVMVKPPPKAITSTGFKKERLLIFGHRITGDHAVLAEGPIDALKAHLCGGNVCTWGKLVSRYQLNLLRTSGIKRLYLALDPDAFVEAGRVLREMSDDVEVYDMRPPAALGDGVDLGKLPLEAVPDLMAAAPRLHRTHMFLYLKDHYAA